jgi:hypothetical protein
MKNAGTTSINFMAVRISQGIIAVFCCTILSAIAANVQAFEPPANIEPGPIASVNSTALPDGEADPSPVLDNENPPSPTALNIRHGWSPGDDSYACGRCNQNQSLSSRVDRGLNPRRPSITLLTEHVRLQL